MTRLRMRNLNCTDPITPRSKLVAPKSDNFILTILRGLGWSGVNGWSDVVEDAKFEFNGSNNPLVQVDDSING